MLVNGISLDFLKDNYPEKYIPIKKIVETDFMEYQLFFKAKDLGITFSPDDLSINQINTFHLMKNCFEEEYIKKARNK